MIKVKAVDETTFEVTVEAKTTTNHRVTLTPDYWEKLTARQVEPEILIEKSFAFLLERESNTSILSSFELSLIGHYFPEYERVIKEALK